MKKRTSAKTLVQVKPATRDFSPQGKDEMNLAEFPITVLADRAPRGVKSLSFRSAHGQLTVTGSNAYGLPTALDADVIVSLIQLTKLKNDFRSPKINFTRYELLRLLGWKNEGRNYRRLDESLQRWVGVTLHYDNCWWDNRSKRYANATMHILESVIILEGRSRAGEDEGQELLPLSTFTWNKDFLDSCQSDNLKYLDISVYFSLEHSASKRLYRFLDKRFYYRPNWVFDLAEIAFDRVGLSRNYASNIAKIKEKLQPAIAELEAIKFLGPLSKSERYFKDAEGWKIRLDKYAAHDGPPGAESDSEILPIVKELIDRGVSRAKGEELVQAYPLGLIEQKIEIYDWMVEKRDQRIQKNPAGWLVRAVEDDYAAPKGFEPKAVQLQRQEEQEEQSRKATDERRRQQEEKARQRQEQRAIAAYRDSLTPKQRATLEAQALAQADEETRRNYEESKLASLKKTLLFQITEEHIRQLLRWQQEARDPQ